MSLHHTYIVVSIPYSFYGTKTKVADRIVVERQATNAKMWNKKEKRSSKPSTELKIVMQLNLTATMQTNEMK